MKVRKTKFSWYLWYWTNGNESLFDLDKDALKTFELLVYEAFKH